ncbi:phage integrase N-terminal SAM-like domain-containing protein [Algiphilus sp. W345]|uniref:Phage integrase N-terminal SAM-like domain-containing protein n=1 Tax=Banduia mediterranea TaxID=3075609 RepID=A0ABU2WER5_9GAMM|nr:phage integrase N-terminal SAM-like domain-containing protein [Algiphilus sp. W345]MDT0496109.1 phage integrase N-terminal SAM-like domain-containing protein [Algiphilus sp. W345]
MRTEDTCVHWIKRFIVFHGKRHPANMGAGEVEAFLSHLAVDLNVAANTQNLALASVLFLYRDVLDVDLPWMSDVSRARKPQRFPVVLSRSEVERSV